MKTKKEKKVVKEKKAKKELTAKEILQITGGDNRRPFDHIGQFNF